MREKVIDGTVLGFALLLSVRAGARGEARLELALPWIEALCLIVCWHSASGGYQLIREISNERLQAARERELPLLTSSGLPVRVAIPSDLPRFYRVRVGGMAFLLCAVAIALAYLSFIAVKRPTQTSIAGSVPQPTIQNTPMPQSAPTVKPPKPKQRLTQRPKEAPAVSPPQVITWEKPVTKILPPRADESKMLRALLQEKDKIIGMEPKEAVVYYRNQATELEVFHNAWLPIENQFDEDAPAAPLNDTPKEQKRYEALVKLDQIRITNYLKYRDDLPKFREQDFRESFPLVSAQLDALADKCAKKGFSIQDGPSVSSESAQQIADFFRANAERCLGGN